MSKKSKIWIASILAVISVAAAIGGITMYLVNKWEVIITLKGDSTSTVEYGDTWKDPGATAYGTSTLFTFTHDDLKLHTTEKSILPKSALMKSLMQRNTAESREKRPAK